MALELNLPVTHYLRNQQEMCSDNVKCAQLLDIYDGMIFLWCCEKCCLISQCVTVGKILKADLGREESLASVVPQSGVKIYILSHPPVWLVKKIKVSSGGGEVLVVGENGVGVIELPHHWWAKYNSDDKDSVTCRIKYVAERFFSCNLKLEVVTAKWHPGYIDSSHIVVLSTDSYLRIYDLSSPDIPVQAICVSHSPSLSLTESSLIAKGDFGELPVDIDFGLPVGIVNIKSSIGLTEFEELKQTYQSLQWPVFILYGNGDVYYAVLSTARKKIPGGRNLYGPLRMYPQSEDNYGLDACSIAVLPSCPPVVVIANTSGRLYHCVVVNNEEAQAESSDSVSVSEVQSFVKAPQVSLYVYEAIDLELNSFGKNFEFLCPLIVSKDPSSAVRYFVHHEAGVHCIVATIVEDLISFSDLPEDSQLLPVESESVIDHLVCTRSCQSAGELSVIGVCALSPSLLLVLLTSGSLLSLPLTSALLPKVQRSEKECGKRQDLESASEPFDSYIQRILKRSLSHPLLMSGASGSVSSEEFYNVQEKALGILRSQYLLPQQEAKNAIEKRVTVLIHQKEHLQNELEKISGKKDLIVSHSEHLAVKYEETLERQKGLNERVELVLNSLMSRLPTLSAAESKMLSELEEINGSLPVLEVSLKQVKTKHAWQVKQLEKQKPNEAVKSLGISPMTNKQLEHLKGTLAKESDKLHSMVEKLKEAKKTLQM